MSRTLQKASAIAVAATVLTIVFGAEGSGAAAQALAQAATIPEPSIQIDLPEIAPPPGPGEASAPVPAQQATEQDAAPAASLADLVAEQPQPSELSRDMQCLASAIYFEARSESLAGQLAVGRVVVARAKSGRFPNSYCGVVYQPSQFSFVRGRTIPAVKKQSKQWRKAVAIAQIAHSNAWASPVEGALFFHAAYVSPGWRLERLGRVDNHMFYR